MFERRDVFPSLFLFLLIATIMVTLSQILVVHHSNHQGNTSRDMKKFRELIKKLERCIESMLKKDVLPLEKYENEFRAVVYSSRIAQLVNKTKATTIEDMNRETGGSLSKTNSYAFDDDRKSRHLQNVHMVSNMNRDSANHRHLPRMDLDIGPRLADANGEAHGDTKEVGHAWSRSLIRRKRRKTEVPLCPAIPDDVLGALKVDVNISLRDVSRGATHGMLPGGAWRPRDCVARHRVAIVIPYRDRHHHLQVLLHYLLPILRRQQLDFRIFVVEQSGNKTFNKGRVMNAAFKEASKMADFQCFVFHDVDLLPENDRNLYSCPSQPRHMSPAVDKFKYRLPYTKLVGGVFSIQTEHFQKVNGYSNLYWGWGAEDDDMAKRLDSLGLNITRPPSTIGRYKMMRHIQSEKFPYKWRFYLLQTVKSRFRRDGLNSVDYKTKFINNTALYTHIMVDVGDPPTTMPAMGIMNRTAY